MKDRKKAFKAKTTTRIHGIIHKISTECHLVELFTLIINLAHATEVDSEFIWNDSSATVSHHE